MVTFAQLREISKPCGLESSLKNGAAKKTWRKTLKRLHASELGWTLSRYWLKLGSAGFFAKPGWQVGPVQSRWPLDQACPRFDQGVNKSWDKLIQKTQGLSFLNFLPSVYPASNSWAIGAWSSDKIVEFQVVHTIRDPLLITWTHF